MLQRPSPHWGKIKWVGSLFQAKSFGQACPNLPRGKVDRVLAAHCGFTDEELDCIPSARLRAGPSTQLRAGNYDIKYRMGREEENEEE